ncbi:non-ribosomal peptide synthetase [Acaryochloris marina]|uniref:Nonribosomal polyketide synthase protein n=1 Tax=Acaryochloris marina (strain MBIC 11017) TaxID=329726 RepID=A8ZKN2_ACAM1|nr:non-ribosomal peptide synthetase [Acaryochloris marina]ABW31350.1 nonribosomal polyketide synthase protein [Acaryochloris marina MBIC11017]
MTPSIHEFLFQLSEQGIKLWVEGDRLRCNAPKQVLTEELRSQLADCKADIVQFLSRADARSSGASNGTVTPDLPQIRPCPDDRFQPFPLTDIQQAYWIGRTQAFELSQVSTHFYSELDCDPDLDLNLLTQGWQRLIERHDMLRAIVRPDGQQQILAQVPPYEIAVLDLRGESAEKTAVQLTELRDRISHQVLPSDQWPLFEMQATYYDPAHLRLHISFDLLTSDARSIEIVFRELGQLMQQPNTEFTPIELSFRDYILAEIAFQNSDAYRRSRDYWQRRLATLPPSPELPLAVNLAGISAPRFVRHHQLLERDTWQRLKTQAAQIGITPSTLILTAFAEILTVWSKKSRFTLNLTLFNRLPLHPQVNDLVGDFTSLTLLSIDHTQASSLIIRARQIQAQLWTDLEHHHYSGVQVLRDLARSQGEGTAPLMPVVFTSILNPEAMGERPFPLDWLGQLTYAVSQTPQVYLDHQVSEVSGALKLTWDVVEAIFPAGLIKEMFAAYCALLNRLAQEDDLWHTPQRQLLLPHQLKQIEAINATDTNFVTSDSAPLLHTLFFDQAIRQPEQIAIATPDRTLTYQELCDRVHQLSYFLHQQGIQPQDRVAIVMAKGWEQIVAALGILSLGAVYIPIDAALPQARQWQLFAEADVTYALTQSVIDATLEWPPSLPRISVDTLSFSSISIPSSPTSPTDLAYIIYTSGSTGQPKGVMIDHRGAVNTILDINQRFGVTSADRVLALSSLSFDLSVYDIFGTLAAGGTLVIPAADGNRDPAHWLNLIERHHVTIWNSVPALMQMLVEFAASQPDRTAATLRLVLLSGDWLPLSLPDQIRSIAPRSQVISLGGATEASIWSILYPIKEVDPTWRSIPYGRPMANQRFYVLNAALSPCPVWVTGQLYIGGIGLAQGYWRNHEKTQASFMVHPHTQERLYKSGDLGRYQPDGTIEFLGREDFQVKVNGHRIELGEIEATLLQHPAVRHAIVTTIGAPRDQQQLVAYIVPDSPAALTPASSPSFNAQVEAHEPRPLDGTLTDPAERLDFKLQQRGVRSPAPSQSGVQLPKPEFDDALVQAYWQRQSHRQFLEQPISLEAFSQFLSSVLQMQVTGLPLPKYRYASAGSLYPVQVYLYLQPNRVEDLAAGFYYYHPVDHQLLLLSDFAEVAAHRYGINQAVFADSSFSLFLIGQLQAIAPMYGELARDFCLLEAGYMSQLLMEAASQQEIGLCPIGTLDFAALRSHFCLEDSHILLHSFVGGKIDPTWTKQAASVNLTIQAQNRNIQGVQKTDLQLELSSFLQQKLPRYMVPSAYVVLETLPLTANGKVDRKALPLSDNFSPPQQSVIKPQTQTERMVARVWQEILQLETAGIHDNFFELGGNSLLMIRTQVKLQELLHQEIPIVELFKSPTIHALASYLSQHYSSSQQTESSTKKGGQRAQLRGDRQALRDQRKQSRQSHRSTHQS